MRHTTVALALIALALGTGSSFGDEPSGRRQVIRPKVDAAPAKIEPYDPDRMKAGKEPGFVDLGNGTEMRVGGRTRLDYDVRH